MTNIAYNEMNGLFCIPVSMVVYVGKRGIGNNYWFRNQSRIGSFQTSAVLVIIILRVNTNLAQII